MARYDLEEAKRIVADYDAKRYGEEYPDKLLVNLGRARIIAENDVTNRQLIEELPLTEAQIDVIRWISHGLSDKMIADVRGTSEWTVKGQVRGAMRKLNAKNRTHLGCKALRLGVIN
jgi:DNA-binding NarL/FixJ family response regulator